MSSEARTVRPFQGLAHLEDVLAGSVFHFGPDACPANSSISLEIDAHNFGLRPAVLEWATDDIAFTELRGSLVDGVEALDISAEDVSLLVVASTAYLKDAQIVLNHRLADVSSLQRRCTLSEPDRSPAFRAWQNGFSVDAFAVLNRSIASKPLRPWRKGTWLTRATFALRTRLGSNLFRPVPLNDETRRRLQLPPKTMRYIAMGDHDPFAPFDGQGDEPTFYVDEDVLAELSAAPRSSATSAALQLQLALDFIAEIIHTSSRQAQEDPHASSAVANSLLDSIIKLILGTNPSETERSILRGELRSDPSRVIAKAEDSLNVQAEFVRSLKGPDQ